MHKVTSCNKCTRSLDDKKADHIKRQVVEVEIKTVVIEHQAEVKRCPCGHKNIAQFPEGINAPVQYGNSIGALAINFTNQFIPAKRTAELLEDLLGIPMSDTTVLNFQSAVARNLLPIYQKIEQTLKDGGIKYFDETGFRIKGKTEWLHVMSSPALTHYRIGKRGSLLEEVSGIVVHDHWKSYFKMPDVEHALCNAHHLRELKAILEFDGEAWAPLMSELLLLANDFSKKQPSGAIDHIYELYDQIIGLGFHFHQTLPPLESGGTRGRKKQRDGYNLLVRLRDFKKETLRFLTDHLVPFTNNLAEQDLRMMKVKQKVSGCFRTEQGALEFAIIRSFASSARKQGLNIFHALSRAFRGPVYSF